MLVHVQTMKQNQDAKDEFLFRLPLTWDVSGQVYTISKRSLCSAVQMLQQNEFTTILSDSKFSMVLSSKGRTNLPSHVLHEMRAILLTAQHIMTYHQSCKEPRCSLYFVIFTIK
jgi:hypothetical protein